MLASCYNLTFQIGPSRYCVFLKCPRDRAGASLTILSQLMYGGSKWRHIRSRDNNLQQDGPVGLTKGSMHLI